MIKTAVTIVHRNGRTETIPLLNDEIFIGREQCDITLEDVKVSRKHACIAKNGSILKIKDLDSSNGTFLNGNQISEIIISDGQIVKMGDSTLTFHIEGQRKLKPLSIDAKTVQLDARALNLAASPEQEKAEDAKRARKDLAAIYRSSQDINALLNSSNICAKTLDIILQEIDVADCCSIHIFNEATSVLECKEARFREPEKFSEMTPFSQTILDSVLNDMKSTLVTDAQGDNRYEASQSIMGMRILSAMCVPLQSRDKILGVIQANTLKSPNRFSEDDLKLVTAIGMLVGQALENAGLYEKLQKEKDALKDAQNSLFQSEKLAAVGLLTAGIVHDVKNPMMVILGYAKMLKSVLKDSELKEIDGIDISDCLNEIENGVNHSTDIINNLLQFSRETPPDKINTQLNDIVKGVLDFTRHELTSKQIKLDSFFEKDIPEICADPNQIKQALLNIIINAIQAVERKGNISIMTFTDVIGSRAYASVTIRDDGYGMSEDVKKKIFDPFFSTKDPSMHQCGGTGLGLSMTYGIIQSHGGKINIESSPGNGSEFTVQLPTAKSADANYSSTATANDLAKIPHPRH